MLCPLLIAGVEICIVAAGVVTPVRVLSGITSSVQPKNIRNYSGLCRHKIWPPALNITDFNPDSGQLSVVMGKGRKPRQLFVSEPVVHDIDTWIRLRGHDPGPLLSRVLKNGQISPQRLTPNGLAYILKCKRQRFSTYPP